MLEQDTQHIDTNQDDNSGRTLTAIAEQYGNIAELAKCVGQHLYNREIHDANLHDQRRPYQLIRERINALREAYEAAGEPFDHEFLNRMQAANNKKLRELPKSEPAKSQNIEPHHRQSIILQLAHVYPGRIQISETFPYGPFFDFTSEVLARAGIKVSYDDIRHDWEAVKGRYNYETV
jgi:hypothetical protein